MDRSSLGATVRQEDAAPKAGDALCEKLDKEGFCQPECALASSKTINVLNTNSKQPHNVSAHHSKLGC